MRSLFKVTEMRNSALMICLALFVLAPFVVHAQDATMSAPVVRLQPDSATVKEGDVFNVTVVIENLAADDGMAGVEFVVTWNSTILNVVNMDEVLFHEITPQSEWGNIWQLRLAFNNTEGVAEYGCLWLDFRRAVNGGYCPVNGISGNHTLATITMEAVGAGSTSIQLPHVLACDQNANPLIDFGEMVDMDPSGNLIPQWQPTLTTENVTYPPFNFTANPAALTVSPDAVSVPENVTEIQKQDAPEVTEMPLVMLAMLATISGVFIALPARWRRVRREH